MGVFTNETAVARFKAATDKHELYLTAMEYIG